jgi:hypothetical protein
MKKGACYIKVVLLLCFMLILVSATACGIETSGADKKGPFLTLEGRALDNQVIISLNQLKKMKAGIVEDDYFSLNSYGTKEYFSFKGVWIWHLINNEIGLKKNPEKVTFIAEDGYFVEYTVDEIRREDYMDEQNPDKKYKMILAWEENEKEYDPATGSPFRLVVGQKESGDVNKPNWVQNVQIIQID